MMEPAAGVPSPDDVAARLGEMLSWVAEVVAAPDLADDRTRIDRIALAERVKAALEALQAVEIVAFARSQVAEQQSLDVDPRKLGRGIAD